MDASGQQRIIREVDAWHHVRRTECDLLRFREKVVWVAIEHHAAHRHYRHELFGNDLRGVENVEAESLAVFFREDLKPELPFRILACLDGLPQVATMVV